ncbi:MAG: hypothetical protein COW00_11905 [Bdellovibrio sp. CG12_big_fil_rev_8_21_14_0_65_39_13]|nr:MAG: hypothetical protein COW78_00700 [Bdellovibrio sp. CG22_combo_CG10-13_8_21_14_all_39_27]PIQ59158.1 MAG: hypothetical protein COW00_11905 [Bdellovibrio sp. CG12_big_fil_rev_8_21_14_0_65_39_13]PIR33298.1 MAG: hypothetical protein COV37_16695 [Bdellovibrio sp. CG11_big_fil_rev_8_21_14_0_20_39_38]
MQWQALNKYKFNQENREHSNLIKLFCTNKINKGEQLVLESQINKLLSLPEVKFIKRKSLGISSKQLFFFASFYYPIPQKFKLVHTSPYSKVQNNLKF